MRWAGGLCAAFALGFVAWALWPTGVGSRQNVAKGTNRGFSQSASACMDNLRGLATSLSLYAGDSGQRLPAADNWSDDVRPYLATTQIVHCPDAGAFGYAFHRELGGRPTASVPSPGSTPLVFDSSDLVANANDDLASLPAPPRHADGRGARGNLTSFLDGHVDWVRP